MRKQLLTAVACLGGLAAFAQQASPEVKAKLNLAVPMNQQVITGNEQGGSAMRASGGSNQISSSLNGRVIGTTTYDLQTNASVQNRLYRHSDGSLSAVWTYSNDYSLAAPDRGTGYNYKSASGTWGSAPTSRIESERGGWPSILGVGSGEVNTLHNTTSSVITMNKRSVKGTGTWSESNITSANIDLIWNRTAVGGPTGQTIHMVGVSAPTANGGSLYQGLDGALLYYRSLNGGITWDRQNVILPGLTSSEWIGFTGDAYSIQARGNTVALAYFDDWGDVVLIKSTDNGTTWTKTIVNDFPIDMYVPDQPCGSDVDGDCIPDTILTSDGSGSMILDGNGQAHVFYGAMRVLDDDLTDGVTSYFPYTNGLFYWNESIPTDSAEFITGALDYDGDGVAANPNETDIAAYFMSLSSMPNAVYDNATGDIYLTYSAYMELLSNGAQSYRHVFAMKSEDGGCSWGDPIDLTAQDNFAECVFASVATSVGDSLRFIYQEDIEPGLAVRGDEDGYDLNDIVYVSVATSTIPSAGNDPFSCVAFVNGVDEFCTGDTVTLTASCGSAYSWSTGETSQSIDVSAHGTYAVTITTGCGDLVREFTTSAPSSAPVAMIGGDSTLCGGGSAVLTANAVSLGSYLWSTGDTTMSITPTATGVYGVTVTNCGGSDSAYTAVTGEQAPANTVTASGNLSFCEGTEALTLIADEGTSWAWSNGDTTQSIIITDASQAGVYTVTVSNDCGDQAVSADITVNVFPQPSVPTISFTSNSTYQSSATSGNQWFVNLQPIPGATGTTFDASGYPNEYITVQVTDANGCVSEMSDAQLVGMEHINIGLAGVNVYPNPNNGAFNVAIQGAEAGVYTLRIRNVIGQEFVSTKTQLAGSQVISFNDLNLDKGLYILSISNDKGENTFPVLVQ